MSQDLLEKILKNKVKSNLDELIKFLITFKNGNFIYPSVIKRKFKMSDKEVYEILSILEDEKLVKLLYEVFCYQCNTSNGLFEYYSQLSDITTCENCEANLNATYNVKIVYKVVK